MLKAKYFKNYFNQVLLASAIALVTIPYIWITNLTASRPTIIFHALIMWLVTPLFMTTAQWLIYRLNLNGFKRMSGAFIIYTIALLLAAATMIFLIHEIAGISYKILVVPPLYGALLPVYTLYLIFLFRTFWQNQKEHELRLVAEKDRAAFTALSAQFKPHFFFNSLNTLEYLIESDPQKAQICLRLLAGLYRQILENSNHRLISLNNEISLVEDYLKIQKYRYQDRLQVQWNINYEEASSIDRKLPPHLLLSLIENSIKYGVESLRDSKPISIDISSDSSYDIIIIVENEVGTSETIDSPNSTGFGLFDAKKRLALIYGKRAQINLNRIKNHVSVTLKIRNELV